MTVIGRRTSSFAFAAVLVAVGLTAGPAQADTPYLTYSCKLPVIGPNAFPMMLGTNARATLKAGKSVTPTLTTRAKVSPQMANLMSQQLGARKVEGTIVASVKINGAPKTITQKVAAKAILANNTAPLVLVATGKLPKVTAKKTGTVTYLPGNMKVTLKFSKSSGASAGAFPNMACTMPRNSATIDRIKFVK